MKPHPEQSARVSNREKRGVKVRMRAEGRSTKCSISFKCIHAVRHTPYLPEVLQKGRGRPGRWAGQRDGRERRGDDGEEEGRGYGWMERGDSQMK